MKVLSLFCQNSELWTCIVVQWLSWPEKRTGLKGKQFCYVTINDVRCLLPLPLYKFTLSYDCHLSLVPNLPLGILDAPSPLPSCKGVLWDKLVTTSLSWQVYLEVCLLSQTLPRSKLTLDYVCHSHYSFALHECTLRYGYIPCAMFVVAIPPSLHDHL